MIPNIRLRRLVPSTIALAVASAVALSACSAGGGTRPSTAPPTDSAAPTQPPGSLEPASRYGLDCASLVDEALAPAVLTVPVDPVDPLVTASAVGIAIPRPTSVIAEGGTVCEWSNGAPYNSQYGGNPAYAGVTVSVLPEPAAGWSSRAAQYGMPADATACDPALCTLSRVAGDAWLTLEAAGGTVATIDPAAAEALMSAAVAAVTAAGVPTPLPTPARTAPPLPSDCDSVLPTASVQSITGEAAAVLSHGGGGWSDWAEARLAAGDEGCRWAVGEENVATVNWIRDGRWAFDRAQAAGTFAPATVAGLPAGDEARVRCDAAYGTTCAVDLAFGPDWINVSGADQATAIALAEAVVAQLAR